MKKLLTLLVALVGALSLTGCVEIEEELPNVLEGDFSNVVGGQNKVPAAGSWETVVFKTLTGAEDLHITRDADHKNGISILNEKYDQDSLAVVLFNSDCEKSKEMAPYLDEISTRIFRAHGVNYIPVFLDINEDSEKVNVAWANNLSNIETFMNSATVCSGNACKEVFLPKIAEALTGTVYFVNRKDITKSKKGFSWEITNDPKAQAKQLEAALAEFLDLEEILFDPSVGDWTEDTSTKDMDVDIYPYEDMKLVAKAVKEGKKLYIKRI